MVTPTSAERPEDRSTQTAEQGVESSAAHRDPVDWDALRSGRVGVLPGPPRPPATWSGERSVVLVTIAVGALAWWFARHQGIDLLYADARSHLTIARRLVDGAQPGLAQLGTVWLPLQHLVLAPLTLAPSGWTNWAAPLVGLVSLTISTTCLWRITWRLTGSIPAAWVAVAVVLANPGWLYLHTTALQEPVLFAAALLAVAGLTGWAMSPKPYSGGELALFVGFPTALAVLTRYDGWALAIAGSAAVAAIAQQRWHQWRYTVRCVRSFVVLPSLAMAWWLWFNFANWGDPLEFQRGQFSAQAQQRLLIDAGLLSERGDMAKSLSTYTEAVLHGATIAVTITALAGFAILVRRMRTQPVATAAVLLAVPGLFYVVSLYTGQIAVRTGAGADPSMFNLRYGLQLLPAFGCFVAVLYSTAASARWFSPRAAALSAALVVLAAPVSTGLDWRSVPVVAEGLQQRSLGDDQWAAAAYLARYATDGSILIDDSVLAITPLIGADLGRVVAPWSGPGWGESLRDPRAIDWIITTRADNGDAVATAIANIPTFAARFEPVFARGDVTIYHRRRPL